MTINSRKILAGVLVGVLITASLMLSVFSCDAQAETSDINLYSSDQVLAAMVEKATSIKEYTDYKEGKEVTLNGDSITFDGTGAKVVGSDFIISEPGTYVFSGTLEDGSIIVESAEKKNVQLVLENANITCKDGAAVFIKECGKNVILSVPEGTTNKITDGRVYENEYVTTTQAQATTTETTDNEETTNDTEEIETKTEPSAAIFSKADLFINGKGTLNVNANYEDGIKSKDDVEIRDVTLVVNAVGDGIVGKDCVVIGGGNITITADGDGIKSTHSEDATKGYIAIAEGNFTLTTGNDGIQAETTLLIVDGKYDITTGEGAEAATASSNKMNERPQGFMEGQREATGGGIEAERKSGVGKMEPPTRNPEDSTTREMRLENFKKMEQPPHMMQQQTTTSDTTETASDSMKALKAGTQLLIQTGTFEIDAQDDAIHSNGTISIGYPTIEIATGDDGLHADDFMEIYGGELNITQSYEGIESAQIIIYGGKISIVASDDGINVAGKNDSNSMGGPRQSAVITETSETSQTLTIKGGTIDVNANGDGIDINGSGYMTGGVVTVSGPTSNGDGGLDYDDLFEVTGGTLLVAGSSGMAQAPSSGTTINTIATAIDTQAAGTEISLVNSDGKTVLSFTPEKEFAHVVITSSFIESGKSYTIVAGTKELVSFSVDDTVTNLSSGNGGMGGGMKRPEGTTSGGGITHMPEGQGRPTRNTL